VSSDDSPALADALTRGKLDLAFLRPEPKATDLVFKLVATEPLVVVLPSDHNLASREAVGPRELVGQPFISVSNSAPVLRAVIAGYLKRSGVDITPDHEADNLAMTISLIASTRGVALSPAYIQNLLPGSLVSRPLRGVAPTIDLVIGYHRANASPILRRFVSRVDDLIARLDRRSRRSGGGMPGPA